MACCTRASLARSSWEVASSSSRMAGSTSRARARAMSWRWPADSDRPRSLTGAQVAAGLARRRSRGRRRPGPPPRPRRRWRRAGRRRCCRGTCPVNRNASWGTMPSWRRKAPRSMSRRSMPSTRTAPADRVVEAGDQLHDGRLAGAGLAHQGHRLARGDGQVDAVEGLVAHGAAGSGSGRRRSGSRPTARPGSTGWSGGGVPLGDGRTAPRSWRWTPRPAARCRAPATAAGWARRTGRGRAGRR